MRYQGPALALGRRVECLRKYREALLYWLDENGEGGRRVGGKGGEQKEEEVRRVRGSCPESWKRGMCERVPPGR